MDIYKFAPSENIKARKFAEDHLKDHVVSYFTDCIVVMPKSESESTRADNGQYQTLADWMRRGGKRYSVIV